MLDQLTEQHCVRCLLLGVSADDASSVGAWQMITLQNAGAVQVRALSMDSLGLLPQICSDAGLPAAIADL
jgi:hypothetical protein